MDPTFCHWHAARRMLKFGFVICVKPFPRVWDWWSPSLVVCNPATLHFSHCWLWGSQRVAQEQEKSIYIYIYTLPQICIFLDGYLMGYGQQACATFAWDSLCVNSAGQLVSQLRRKRAKGGSLGLVVEAMDHAHNRGKHVFGDQTARMNGFLKCFPADHQPNLLF